MFMEWKSDHYLFTPVLKFSQAKKQILDLLTIKKTLACGYCHIKKLIVLNLSQIFIDLIYFFKL